MSEKTSKSQNTSPFWPKNGLKTENIKMTLFVSFKITIVGNNLIMFATVCSLSVRKNLPQITLPLGYTVVHKSHYNGKGLVAPVSQGSFRNG
jgi:hypothetical protein